MKVKDIWDNPVALGPRQRADSDDVPVVAILFREGSAEPLYVSEGEAAIQASTL
jgi:hypothetical protein